ncbi:MAG: UPF0149 family protein [Gammaproteobacteria bacterium]
MFIRTYDEISVLLKEIDPSASPSETHGLITAFISADVHLDAQFCLDHIFKGKKSKKNRDFLLEIYKTTFQKLNSPDFDFELLVPDDEQPLNERAQALSEWCEGYLTGLNLVGIKSDSITSEDGREALQNMLEIAKLDYDRIETTESDESAYAEVYEYVRMAAILIHTEIAESRGKSSNHIIH